jgi:hypothetical protein
MTAVGTSETMGYYADGQRMWNQPGGAYVLRSPLASGRAAEA